MKPAISLAAIPGRRRQTLDVAVEIERRGFAGLYCPSFGDGLGLCEALALVTRSIAFGTSIVNLYTRHPQEFAKTACLIHELAPGRFRFGIGVSHAPVNAHYGVKTGKPTDDVRRFVSDLRKAAQGNGDLPPVVLATLRAPMVRLAAEIAEGAVWANAARSHMGASLAHLSAEQRSAEGFFVGNMIPACVSQDRAAAAAVMRKTLRSYAALPNYQNYWIEAGYEEEMRAVQRAIAAHDAEGVARAMSDRWLGEVTLFGSAAEVREGFEAWVAAGVKTPILVPSSTSGGQMKAIEELLAAFA
ncbi:MAG: LLM class flavin-dependent oxidoreductase [Deltaproteobacteria bacterium]|nr:LLM class flavin-dependent oxidoreductase [Deltaproteobacteria bacterium]